MTELRPRRQGESIVDYMRYRSKALGLNADHEPKPVAPTTDWDTDLVPTVELNKSPEQYEMDAVLDGIDMLEAYRRWIGKMEPNVGSKRKNIMISCPMPDHADRDPSADINLDEGPGGVWHCHRCSIGGDKYTIAAIRFGFDLNDYQSKENFPELRRLMAEDLGYKVVTGPGKEEWLEREVVSDPAPTPSEPSSTPSSLVSVTNPEPQPILPDIDDDGLDDAAEETPGFDWRGLGIRSETFLETWMNCTSESYEPEEYYLFEGLMALSCAVGNDVKLVDAHLLRLNMMICLIGGTSVGKSLSISMFNRLIEKAMPFNPDTGSGVRMISGVGSGEALVDQFRFTHTDIQTNQTNVIPINGLIQEPEFAAFSSRARRQGSTLQQYVMDFFDSSGPIRAVSRMAGGVEARDHFAQFISTTQPKAIRDVMNLTEGNSGFLNRWIYVFGTPKERPAISDTVISIDPAIDPLRRIRAWASGGRQISWNDPTGKQAFLDFWDREIKPIKRRDDQMMSGRIDIVAKKILALLAVNDRVTAIMPHHIETLERLWPFIIDCYANVEGRLGLTEQDIVIQEIIDYMKPRADKKFNIRVLRKQSAAKKYPLKVVVDAVELLKRAGILIPDTDRKSKTEWLTYRDADEPTGGTLTVISGGRS